MLWSVVTSAMFEVTRRSTFWKMSFPLRALPLTKRTGGSTLQRERTRARQPYVVLKFFGRSEITALFMLEVFVESRIEKSKAERFTSRQSRLESPKLRERQYQSLHYCVLTWFYSQEKHLRNNSGWQREHRSFLTIFPPSCRRLNVKSQHTRLRPTSLGKKAKIQTTAMSFDIFWSFSWWPWCLWNDFRSRNSAAEGNKHLVNAQVWELPFIGSQAAERETGCSRNFSNLLLLEEQLHCWQVIFVKKLLITFERSPLLSYESSCLSY